MIEQQEKLVAELLNIRDGINKTNDLNTIAQLVDEAIVKSRPVPPNSLNEDILGKERILEGKFLSMKLLLSDKELTKSNMPLEYIKFQIITSLVMLMLRFANGISAIDYISKKKPD